jgi:signal transduction histidine kinase
MSRRLDAARDQRVAHSSAWRLRESRSEPSNARRSSEREPTRDAEFDQLARDLHQLLRETDGRLDRLGHDTRVVLTVIKGRAQLLRRQALATDAPDLPVIRSMDEIERAVARLHRLLNDQLAASAARSPTETGDGRADER